MLVIATGDGTSGAITGVVTTTNGTTTDTLSKVGGCFTGTSPTMQWCFYWIDRVTAGVNGVTCSTTNSGGSYKLACLSLEIAGTISSGSVDKSEYDSSWTKAQSFTSGSTTATTQATELLVGFVYDSGSIRKSKTNFVASRNRLFYLATQTRQI
jgi:hypothetical protein